jgi:magnesium transporter
MRKMVGDSSATAGLPPGSLVHVGERKSPQPEITIADYDAQHYTERVAESIDECRPFRDTPTVTWINVAGIHDIEALRTLAECYHIHPLVMEDILNTHERPKFEEFDDYLFIVVKMLGYDAATKEVVAEQVSLIVGPNVVISFEEAPRDAFDAVRARIRNEKGRIRSSGADYLAYCLLDTVVDNYFSVLEGMAAEIEEVEDQLLADPSRDMLQRVHGLKRELIFLRKSVWPLREVLAVLERADSSLIRESTVIYLRDVYDHTIQIVDTIESLRDIVSGMHDTYLSSVSNRLNEVMKVLTIWATIFIPLTFLAGVYGMNFKYFPELGWKWGYAGFWAIIVTVSGFMLLHFRKKKWL